MSYMDKFKLDGKNAVIVGGLGLIGKEVTKALTEAGANVTVLDKNNFDIAKPEGFDDVLEGLKPIHVFVNVSYPKTEDWGKAVEHENIESWKENIDMQLNSACLLSLKVAELMKKDKIKGSIINTGSIYGVTAPDFTMYEGNDVFGPPASYAAIKGGLLNFCRHSASKYGKYGIRINCICPGGIKGKQDKSFVKKYEKRTPLGRMGNPEDVASSVVFLASDSSSYITGTQFMIDGGWTCI